MSEPSARKNPLGPTGVIAARRVRELRQARGWGFKELSDRLADAGRQIPPLGLRKIEKEDRRIDADDLVALAVVLRVNPSALLLPPSVDGDVEITGDGVIAAKHAWRWMDGRGPLHEPADDGSAAVEFELEARPVGARRLSIRTPAGRAAIADEAGRVTGHRDAETDVIHLVERQDGSVPDPQDREEFIAYLESLNPPKDRG